MQTAPRRQIANAHTIFNVFNSIIFIIALPYFTRLITTIVPGKEVSFEIGPTYLDERMLPTPAAAIGGAKKELLRMAVIARDMVGEALSCFIRNDLKKVANIEQMEELLDGMEKSLNVFLADLSQSSLTEAQSKIVSSFMSAANDWKGSAIMPILRSWPRQKWRTGSLFRAGPGGAAAALRSGRYGGEAGHGSLRRRISSWRAWS